MFMRQRVSSLTQAAAVSLLMPLFLAGCDHDPALPEPVGDFGPIGAGATVEQDFTWFIHEFHGYLPPEGWQFSIDGAPPEPPVPA